MRICYGTSNVGYAANYVEFAPPVPSLSHSPGEIEFGVILAEESSTKTMKLTNLGASSLIIDSVHLTGPDAFSFEVINNPCDGKALEHGESCQIQIEMFGQEPGLKEAQVEILSNDPKNPEELIPLKGEVAAFRDVTSTTWPWAYEYVNNLYSEGITRGCGDEIFCPEKAVTRAELAAFLVRALEEEPDDDYCGDGSPFADVPQSNPFCKYIKRAKELHLTKGCDLNRYCPSQFLTRAELAVFFGRAFLGME